ncbi:Protein of unknown function (DUF1524) [Bartonella apihabitans]|nr:Protein of unknown function (DUF1524) [Bartonella apihabitans]
MLILRAFYDKFANMQDRNSKLTREMIEKCIWKTDTFGTADKNNLKINSEVATDKDKEEFLELLKTGEFDSNSKSKYVVNYRFFKRKIDEFLNEFPSFFPYLPARILNNCILLPIEAESQDTALRIFSTLNDRGLPLSDADIFKAQFYKYYGILNKKDEFIENWKWLEDKTGNAFKSVSNAPMDELFTRYMYFLRAKEGNRRTTTDALRRFFERDKYKYLNQDHTIPDLMQLASFWMDISTQNEDKFTIDVLKKLFVLSYAPNGMWQQVTSVYFLQNRDSDGNIDNDRFYEFLNKITHFIFAYAITNPGVNALRTPIYDEMVNIIHNEPVTFSKFRFSETQLRTLLQTYEFTNQRAITRSLITWYAYSFPEQKLMSLYETFQLEHIYAKKRQQVEHSLKDERSIDALGNKILLESVINIRASDYHFVDKKKIYSGDHNKLSHVYEISEIIKLDKFDEDAIKNRTNVIIDKFILGLKNEKLIM